MGIRVRPIEVDILDDDPFANDLLGRKEPAKILTQLVDGVEGPCVLAIDAAWGAGKTTFLNMWAQHLRNGGFPVVKFNAWETDHAEDPFVALIAELEKELSVFQEDSVAETIRRAINVAKPFLLRAIPAAIRIGTSGIVSIDPQAEKEFGKALASYVESRLAEYNNARVSFDEFRTKLQELAGTLFHSKKHPLVVMVDELDRCRPSYAVELIEVAKHLFGVDHIIFVIAVNRVELAHSIRALYGGDFDATGYLRRFFDVDFRLPDPDRTPFIRTMLSSVNVQGDICALLEVFFVATNVTLRQIGQAICRLGLVVASLNRSAFSALATGVAIVIRTIDDSLYRKFVAGLVSDREIAEAMFEGYGIPKSQKEDVSYYGAHLFEAIVILAAIEISSGGRPVDMNSIESPLLGRYRSLLPKSDSSTAQQSAEVRYAVSVIDRVNSFANWVGPSGRIGFREAVKRIEILEPSDER